MTLYSCPENSLSIIKSMYDSKIHADVQLLAGEEGKEISAHKAVLSSATEYFKVMFDGSFREGVESKVIIQDIDSITLEAVLKFIYCGSVEISSSETATELLKSAHLMELPQLMKYAEEYLLENMTRDVCLEVYFQIKLFNSDSLSDKVKEVIAKEFKYISQREDFKQLDKESFLELINEVKEYISEDDIAEGILSWINFEKTRLMYFTEFLQLTKIESIKSDVIIDMLYEYCTTREQYGLIIKALKKRNSSTKIVKSLNLKYHKLIAIVTDYKSRSLLEYNFIKNVLLSETKIENMSYIVGIWDDTILFQDDTNITCYDLKQKSNYLTIDCDVDLHSNLSCKIGDDVFLVAYHKLNLSTRLFEIFDRPKHLNYYNFYAVCELNGELKIFANQNNNNTIVTYNPSHNSWSTESNHFHAKIGEFGFLVAHNNCLYYFLSESLCIFNLDSREWDLIKFEPKFSEDYIKGAVSIGDKLIVASSSRICEYMVNKNEFKELDIFGKAYKCLSGIFYN